MSFTIKPTFFFLDQVRQLSGQSRRLIGEKLELIKQNPYRSKSIHSRIFSRVFRIRLDLDGKESRLIYAVIEPDIIVVCILERKNDYRDLEKMLLRAMRGEG
ncbi:MAG: hypothetical protein AABX01_01780 [Candidatus Micrarchaeota archaeon]